MDTPTNNATADPPGSPSAINMEVLTPRIDNLRSAMSKDFEKSANRKGPRKNSIDGKDRESRKAMVEGLITARRSHGAKRHSVDADGGKRNISGYVSIEDFESFKRTVEARFQALEEQLEQKDDEVAALQEALQSKSGSAKASGGSPKQNQTPSKLSTVPSLNLGNPASGSNKPSKISSPVSKAAGSPSKGGSGRVASWKGEDLQLFLGQLGVFKLWTASMVCAGWHRSACDVVFPAKHKQLTAGAEPGLAHHAANPEDAEGTMKLLPPLFQPGGPYHTLGVAGFVSLQELLKGDQLELKHLYKFMREVTRKK